MTQELSIRLTDGSVLVLEIGQRFSDTIGTIWEITDIACDEISIHKVENDELLSSDDEGGFDNWEVIMIEQLEDDYTFVM